MTHSEYRLLLKTDRNKAHKMLFDEYLNYVNTIAFNRLRSCASREDINECVMDIFLDVYSSYDTDSEISGDIKGFIGTIAYRRATDHFRRLSKYSSDISLDDVLSDVIPSDHDIAENAEHNELSRILLELIDCLGEPDSSIIIQKYYYGRSAGEIAEMLGISPVTARVRSSRALKKLKKMLSDRDITI